MGFHCDISIHACNVLWSNSHPLILFLKSHPPFKAIFDGFHYSFSYMLMRYFDHMYLILHPPPLTGSHPQTAPCFILVSVFFFRSRCLIWERTCHIVFLSLTYFVNTMIPSSIHSPANNITTFFFMADLSSIVYLHHIFFIHSLVNEWFHSSTMNLLLFLTGML
jgi:hypothetical protein